MYFDRAKSHNNAFYRKTEGVCTNNRMELEKIKRTTEVHPSAKNKFLPPSISKNPSSNHQYWGNPSNILRGEDFGMEDGGISGNLDRSENTFFVQKRRGWNVSLERGEEEGAQNQTVGTGRDDHELMVVESRGDRELSKNLNMEVSQNQEEIRREDIRVFGPSGEGNKSVTGEELEERTVSSKRGNKRKKKFRGAKKKGNLSRYSQREIERQSERNTNQLSENKNA